MLVKGSLKRVAANGRRRAEKERRAECENVEEIVGDGRGKKRGGELRWTTIM